MLSSSFVFVVLAVLFVGVAVLVVLVVVPVAFFAQQLMATCANR